MSDAKPTAGLFLMYIFFNIFFSDFFTVNSSVNPIVDKVNSNGSDDPGPGRVPGKVVEAIIVMDVNIGSANVAECQRSYKIATCCF